MYRGETIYLDFKSGLESDIFIKYTVPGTGEPMMYMSRNPVFYFNLSGLGFNKMNFWSKRFNEIISR